MKNIKINHKYYLGFLTSIWSAFLSFIPLYEFVKVGLLKDINGYYFGAECMGKYYQTAEIYATHSLLMGLIALTIFLLSIIAMIKKNIFWQRVTFLLSVIFTISIFVFQE